MRLVLIALLLLIGGPASATIFDMWFYGDVPVQALAANPPKGVGLVTPSGNTSNYGGLLADGIQVMGGLGGYSAIWAQNQNSDGSSCPTCQAALFSGIDRQTSNGATWFFVDEPWPAPGQASATTAVSIAYNVAGYNIVWEHIHSTCPACKIGLTIGDDGGAPLHLAMLRYANGTPFEDFASEEEYNSCCTRAPPAGPNPFTTQKEEFPNVLTMLLAYGTETLCKGNGVTGSNLRYSDPKNGWFDIIATWDNDLYGGWIGPLEDVDQARNIERLAKTGKTDFCQLPYAWIDPASWTWAVQTANFSVKVDDYIPQTGGPYALDMTSCEYRVLSGANAINGLSDPSLTITRGWTHRTCGASFTVTVGPRGDCRPGTSPALICLTEVRARASGIGPYGSNPWGNMTYQEWYIGPP
jgi:hypothetical protein